MMEQLQKLGDAVEWSALPIEQRAELLTELQVEDVDVSPHLSAHIDSFLASASAEALVRLQLEVVRRGLWKIGAERFVHLVAGLASSGRLSHGAAALALTTIPYPERDRLPEHYSDLMDVADLVVEDAKDAVMQSDDDDIFELALARFGQTGARPDRG